MSRRDLIRHLPIGAQLFLGLGIILALVGLLGAVAWQQADSLWAETQGLYEHPLQVRRAVGEIKADILAMHRGMKDAVLGESDAEMTLALQEIDRYEADAHRQFSIVYDRFLGPRGDIEAAERAVVEWKAIREETIRLLRAGQTAEAIRRTRPAGAGGQHVDLTLAALQKVSDFVAARADEFYANAQAERDALRVRLGLALGGILLLTLAINSLLLRSVRDPLRELTAVAGQYRAGRLDARSRYAGASGNELAVLAAAFNALARTMQAETQSRAASARIAEVMLREVELADFCPALLAELVERTGSQVAALYLLNEARSAFAHYASIGLVAGGRADFSATEPEGEFGATLAARQIQHLSDIPPQTRFTFATVSGDFRPAALLTIPILAERQVVAVISLASIRPYPPAAVRLVHDIWSVLTARFNSVLAHRQLHAFSAQLEGQNRELAAQKQELMAQAAELTAQASELTAQNIELELQKQQLDEANRLKSRFLSNMSHELRTPLNSVIALAGVLRRRLAQAIPAEEFSYLEVIERNGKHLLALINDILDLSRIEAGREEVVLESFAPRDLVAEVIEMIEPQARERGLALRNDVPAGLLPLVSDQAKCRHILQNLIGNAVKFTEAGQVTIAAARVADTLQISVRDTGIGIAADQVPTIFDEFRQADDSAARKYGGAGLGLAIARKYAMLLGGEIAVESTPGRGSTFTVTLPLTATGSRATDSAGLVAPSLHSGQALSGSTRFTTPQRDDREGSRLASRDASAQTTGLSMTTRHETHLPLSSQSRRILLVEDSEPAIIQICDILAGQGYEVSVARDGRAALAQIAQAPPDALILDLMMPEVDGFAVLQMVRSAPATAQLPVLILTARHVTQEELSFLTGNHIQQLIQKGDVSKAELLAAVAGLFAKGDL
jgi:signal transduction histidine kinase